VVFYSFNCSRRDPMCSHTRRRIYKHILWNRKLTCISQFSHFCTKPPVWQCPGDRGVSVAQCHTATTRFRVRRRISVSRHLWINTTRWWVTWWKYCLRNQDNTFFGKGRWEANIYFCIQKLNWDRLQHSGILMA